MFVKLYICQNYYQKHYRKAILETPKLTSEYKKSQKLHLIPRTVFLNRCAVRFFKVCRWNFLSILLITFFLKKLRNTVNPTCLFAHVWLNTYNLIKKVKQKIDVFWIYFNCVQNIIFGSILCRQQKFWDHWSRKNYEINEKHKDLQMN